MIRSLLLDIVNMKPTKALRLVPAVAGAPAGGRGDSPAPLGRGGGMCRRLSAGLTINDEKRREMTIF